jgi:serine phosphatase RsbU (regulator of sigma subunit)
VSAPPRIDGPGNVRAASFAERYRHHFLAYLESGDEADVAPAYELSREAVAEGLSLLELHDVYRRAAIEVVLPEGDPQRRLALAERASDFLRESLATFEIASRGYVEVQEVARAEREHARQLQAIAEASIALGASLEVAEILELVTAEAQRVLSAEHAHVRLDGPSSLARPPLAASAGERTGTSPPSGSRRVRANLTGRRGIAIGELEVTLPPETDERAARASAGAEAILIQLAQIASAAIENARLYSLEREIAETLQHSLLPQRLPEIEGLDLAARYTAAGDGVVVGGDFYDVFPTNGTTWGVAIGDVCGKGPHAAALTALVRYTLRAAAIWERRPEQVMRLLNEAIIEQRDDHRFCTAFYGELRPESSGQLRMDFVSCGHPPPLVARRGERVEAIGTPSSLLGVVSDPVLRRETLLLGPGDRLVLYTDGAIEVRHDGREVFGLPQLRALVGELAGLPAATVAAEIEQAVLKASSGPPRDDLAVLVLRVPE